MSSPSTLKEKSKDQADKPFRSAGKRPTTLRINSDFSPPTRFDEGPLGYDVTGPLNRSGGEADVWLVKDEAGTDWVMKAYHAVLGPDADVLQKVQNIDSPLIVRPVQTGELNGRYYEILPYYSNGSLATLLRQGPMEPENVRSVLRQVAEGIQMLHSMDVIHRDIKPDNLLLRSTEPVEIAIGDFGISRQSEMTLLLTRVALTLHYAAPETLEEVVTKASDWWSVGAMVTELLLGAHPFRGMSDRKILFQLHSAGFPVSESIPREWQHLLRGLLRQNYAERWGYAQICDWLDGKLPDSFFFETPLPQQPIHHDHLPFRFLGQDHYELENLATTLAESWSDAQALMKRPGLVAWLQNEMGETEKSQLLGQILQDPLLDTDQKVTATLLLLSRQMLPCDSTYVLSLPHFEKYPESSRRFFESSLPEWLNRIRGEPLFLELQELRSAVLRALKAESIPFDANQLEKVMLWDPETLSRACAERAHACEKCSHTRVDSFLRQTELTFVECALLLLAPEEWFKDSAACEIERQESEAKSLHGTLVIHDVPVSLDEVKQASDAFSAKKPGKIPAPSRWSHPFFRSLAQKSNPSREESIMLALAAPWFTPNPLYRFLKGLFGKGLSACADFRFPDCSAIAAAFSPDNRLIAVITAERKLVLWDMHRREHVRPPLSLDFAPRLVAFNIDGDCVALAGQGTRQNVRLVPIDGKKPVTLDCPNAYNLAALAFTNEGLNLAAGGTSQSIMEWDLKHGGAPAKYHGNTDEVTALAWESSSRILMAGARSGLMTVWLHPDRHPLFQRDEPGRVEALAVRSEWGLGCSCCVTRRPKPELKLSFWRTDDGGAHFTRTLPLKDPEFIFALSPQLDMLVVAEGKQINCWLLPDMRGPFPLATRRREWRHLVFSAQGGRLMGCTAGGAVRIWNTYELNLK